MLSILVPSRKEPIEPPKMPRFTGAGQIHAIPVAVLPISPSFSEDTLIPAALLSDADILRLSISYALPYGVFLSCWFARNFTNRPRLSFAGGKADIRGLCQLVLCDMTLGHTVNGSEIPTPSYELLDRHHVLLSYQIVSMLKLFSWAYVQGHLDMRPTCMRDPHRNFRCVSDLSALPGTGHMAGSSTMVGASSRQHRACRRGQDMLGTAILTVLLFYL